MKKIILIVSLIMSSILFVRTAQANIMEKINIGFEEGAVIGLGAVYVTRPYKDVDDWVSPMPLINFQYKRFYANGSSVGVYLNDNEDFRLSVVGVPRFWGYEPDDSSALVLMKKRSSSFDGGLRASWKNDLFNMELTAVTDLTNQHEGQEVSAYFKKEFLDGGFTPRVGVRYYSEDMVDYYYGVRQSEVRAGRRAYSPEGALNPVIGATFAVPLGDEEKWAWVLDTQYEFLSDEVADSPIVEDEGVFSIATGIVYRY